MFEASYIPSNMGLLTSPRQPRHAHATQRRAARGRALKARKSTAAAAPCACLLRPHPASCHTASHCSSLSYAASVFSGHSERSEDPALCCCRCRGRGLCCRRCRCRCRCRCLCWRRCRCICLCICVRPCIRTRRREQSHRGRRPHPARPRLPFPVPGDLSCRLKVQPASTEPSPRSAAQCSNSPAPRPGLPPPSNPPSLPALPAESPSPPATSSVHV